MKKIMLLIGFFLCMFGLMACDNDAETVTVPEVAVEKVEVIPAVVASEFYQEFNNEELIITKLTTYDESGAVMSVETYDPAWNETTIETYTYGEVDILDIVITDNYAKYTEKYVMRYDEFGREAKYESYLDGSLYRTWNYEYENIEGNLKVTKTLFNSSGEAGDTDVQIFDSEDRIIFEASYYNDFVFDMTETYFDDDGNSTTNIYDENGNLRETVEVYTQYFSNGEKEQVTSTYDASGYMNSQETLKFDTAGNLVEDFYLRGSTCYVHYYIYENGLLIEETKTVSTDINNLGDPYNYASYQYGEVGNLVYSKDPLYEKFYVYDDGKVMTFTCYQNDGYSWTIDYTYFED